jgi:hypothetical protein
MQKFDPYIGFCEKRQVLCRKLAKITENCDHNIDPRCRGRMLRFLQYFGRKNGEKFADFDLKYAIEVMI